MSYRFGVPVWENRFLEVELDLEKNYGAFIGWAADFLAKSGDPNNLVAALLSRGRLCDLVVFINLLCSVFSPAAWFLGEDVNVSLHFLRESGRRRKIGKFSIKVLRINLPWSYEYYESIFPEVFEPNSSFRHFEIVQSSWLTAGCIRTKSELEYALYANTITGILFLQGHSISTKGFYFYKRILFLHETASFDANFKDVFDDGVVVAGWAGARRFRFYTARHRV